MMTSLASDDRHLVTRTWWDLAEDVTRTVAPGRLVLSEQLPQRKYSWAAPMAPTKAPESLESVCSAQEAETVDLEGLPGTASSFASSPGRKGPEDASSVSRDHSPP
mmetsp:Transcript_61671/g.99705  ORF Transcript_61671/g.99705 Transcript_61671/m.99705 type:complete len:106 (-) Transcript_61671:713-1030(-)